jgi:hypothetical protein
MSLTTDRVRVLLEDVPSLARVVSENRLWTVRGYDRLERPHHKPTLVADVWLSHFFFSNFNSEPTDPIWSRDTTGADEEFEGNWFLVCTTP